MADWYGSRDQLLSIPALDASMLGYGKGAHSLDPSMLGYGMGAATTPAFPPIQSEAYSHAQMAAYHFQRQQSAIPGFSQTCLGADTEWRQGADGSMLELRKEKSRDAARSRRGKENYEFYELAKMLPLPSAITSQLDKASIIRLTISYLKLRDFSLHGDPPWHRTQPPSVLLKGGHLRTRSSNLTVDMFEQNQGTHILQSLDGFAFALAADGRFLYISETVSIYLGLSQVEMTGSSVFDYIHHEDHQELADQLGLTLARGQPMSSPSSVGSEDGSTRGQSPINPDVASLMHISTSNMFRGMERSFCIRMKSTLTKRGCHFKSSGYRVVLVLGHLRPQYSLSRKSQPILLGLVALAIALPPPSVHEVRLESDMFVTRIDFDFRIAHCEPRVTALLDYMPDDLQGRSIYSLCHAEDTHKLRHTHAELMRKGQVMSPYFRVLNKRGGFTWIQICATMICNAKNNDEQNIICVNYVLSNIQCESLILDQCQLYPSLANMKTDTKDFPISPASESTDMGQGPEQISTSPNGVQSSELEADARKVNGSLPLQNSRSPGPKRQGSFSPERGSPDIPVEGAQIKKELTGGISLHAGITDTAKDPADAQTSLSQQVSSPTTVAGQQQVFSAEGATPTPLVSPDAHHLETSPSNTSGVRAEEGSVRNLEAAMTRHLPKDTTDFSTNALLRTPAVNSGSCQKSTIQWVGGAMQHTPLPASTLLRQLYANRESVIRSSVQQPYYTETHQEHPVPQGSHSYPDMSPKGGEYTYPSVDTFRSNRAMPGSYQGYHNAMTPPSSVSPREKMNSECDVRSHHITCGEPGTTMPTQPLPLKPQVYSYVSSNEVPLDITGYSVPLPLGDQNVSYYPHTGIHISDSSHGRPSTGYDALRPSSWSSPSS